MSKQAKTQLLLPGQCIVFDGDSLTSRRTNPNLDTWPYLRLMNWEHSYAERVAEWLFCNRPDLQLSFRHAAIGGSTAADCLSRYDRAVKPHKPDWVVMTISANDANRKVPVKDFKATLKEYALRLKSDSGGRLMVLGGFKPFPFGEAEKPAFRERTKYFKATQQVLAASGGVYVDVGTPLFRKAGQLHALCDIHTIYSDGRHFNAVGNEILASLVLQALGVLVLAES